MMMQNLDLCERCRKVDWANLPDWENRKNWKNPDKFIHSAQFPRNREIEIVHTFRNKSRTELCKSTCPVCHLVGQLVNPVYQGDQGDQLLNVCLEAHGSGKECSYEFPSVKLAVRSPGTNSTKIGIGDNDHYTMIRGNDDHDYTRFLIAHRSTDHTKAGARQLKPSEISFDFFKAKLTECLNNHEECQSNRAEVAGLRVINVNTEKIDDAPKDCEYLALSYVWGPKSSCQCTQEKFLPVVQDAITVTKRLGWKYLWVDQYCIDQQENSPEKESMIRQMNLIYSNACVTIIAASGDSSCVKLPGVVGKPSCKSPAVQPRHQNLITIDETSLVEISNVGSDNIKSSVWATRGWTYQEGYFSKRRLIFTENEVLFLCNKEFRRETQTYHHSTDPFIWMIPPAPPVAHSHQNSYTQIWSHIEEYSKRNLSHDSDGLNAFLGILKDYESSAFGENGPVSHLLGNPLKLLGGSKEGQTYIGLLWKHQSVAHRRENLPSWSWLGWRGPVQDFGSGDFQLHLQPRPVGDHDQNRCEREPTERIVQIHIPHGDGIIDLHSFILERQSGTLSRYVNPEEIRITSFTVPLRFRRVNTYQTIKDPRTKMLSRVRLPCRVVVTFSLSSDVFLGCPIFFDGDYAPESCKLGLVIPCHGRFSGNEDNYMIIILHSVGDGKYERAGIGGFHYNPFSERITSSTVGLTDEDWLESFTGSVTSLTEEDWIVFIDEKNRVMLTYDNAKLGKVIPPKDFFLKGSKWETVRLV